MGIEIPISRIEGKWKASQNRPETDRLGVSEGLRTSSDDASRNMADLVEPEAPRVSPRCFAHLSVCRRSRYTIAMTDGLILHPDNKTRCWWPGTDPFYVAYHDTEWGVPEFDDRALFEKLILDGFQAGLSWITILRKRENFRRAFAGFDPAVIARFDDAQIEALMLDQGIVRNRAKIIGTVAGARAWLAIQERAVSRIIFGIMSTVGLSRTT